MADMIDTIPMSSAMRNAQGSVAPFAALAGEAGVSLTLVSP
jgi:hypothetical protein